MLTKQLSALLSMDQATGITLQLRAAGFSKGKPWVSRLTNSVCCLYVEGTL